MLGLALLLVAAALPVGHAGCPAGSGLDSDGSRWRHRLFCKPCQPGKFGAGGEGGERGSQTCSSCSSGKFAPEPRASSCTDCAGGHYNIETASTQCDNTCAPGYFAKPGSTHCSRCAAGTHSSNGEGAYGSDSCTICLKGTAAGPGASSCARCAAGASASANGAASCVFCAAGKFAEDPGKECAPCAAGDEAPSTGSTECNKCAAGKFAAHGGTVTCAFCGGGTYAREGAVECDSCGDGHFLEDASASGAASQADCKCDRGFTGADCDILGCDAVQRGASLGGLLLEAAWPESSRDMQNAEGAFNTIFRSADTNGDNRLSDAEARAAIASMHMTVPAGVAHVWSRQLGDKLEFEMLEEQDVSISTIVADTIASRRTVDLFLRGGDDVPGLEAMTATYPAADWTAEKCADNLNGRVTQGDGEYAGIAFSWTLDTSEKELYRQCIYRNGVLDDEAPGGISDAKDCVGDGKAKKCTVHDKDGINSGDSDDNRKRLYCVEAMFCKKGAACKGESAKIDPKLTEVRCSTGLAYDGSPADVVPALISSTGVRFSFLDTSQHEDGFRIFRSAVDRPDKTTLIADIPTKSAGCGQPFSPISYYDRDVGDVPGTHVMYTVSTVVGGEQADSTTALFTSPWVGTLTTVVATRSGAPVRNATVSIYHLDDTGTVDLKYAPIVQGKTDAYGIFESEIRVTDRDWAAVKQHFLVNVTKMTGAMPHIFLPPAELVTVQHFRAAEIEFVDESAVSVSGVVRYDLAANDFADAGACAYENVFEGDDTCYCPVRSTFILVDRGGGDTESYATDEAGAFSFSVTFGERVTVRLAAFSGPSGVGRNHTFRLNVAALVPGGIPLDVEDGDVGASSTGTSPSTTFFATHKTTLEFVATDQVRVRVGVLGGDVGAAYVSGQPVVLGLDGCAGFRRTLWTYAGYAETLLPPAPKYALSLGAEGEACSASDESAIFESLKGIRGCRVEMPIFPVALEARLPCSTSKFEFVDEFFTEVGSARDVDLSTLADASGDTLWEELYYFPTPFCVGEIKLVDQHRRSVSSWKTDAPTDWEDKPEAMMLSPGTTEEGPEVYGTTCFAADAIDGVFVEGDKFALAFDLVERHPASLWPWGYGLENGVVKKLPTGMPTGYVESKPLAGAAITALVGDGLSGAGDSPPSKYNASAPEFGYKHHVVVGDPNPFAPFTQVISLDFARALDGAVMALTRHAIVLGVIQDDVPSIYMVATDPTLIFTVLRDPPGGNSFSTITEGTKLKLSMSIAGMHAGALDVQGTVGATAGHTFATGAVFSAFGAGFTNPVVQVSAGAGVKLAMKGPSVAAAAVLSQGHDLEFTFDEAITTSKDPFLAGQPGDVIVGGGANIRVLTAVVVDFAAGSFAPQASDAVEYCVLGDRTHEWLPEQVSTFVVTVYEIEQTMARLGALGSDATDLTKKSLQNWETVLRDYRDVTQNSATTVTGGITGMLSGVISQFEEFEKLSNGGDAAFDDYVAGGLAAMSHLDPDFHAASGGRQGIDADQVQKYAGQIATFLEASQADCAIINQLGLPRDSCSEAPPAVSATLAAAHKLLGICQKFDSPTTKQFCATSADAVDPQSAFDALGDLGRVVTFAGTTDVDLEYLTGEAKSRINNVGFAAAAVFSLGTSASVCTDIFQRRRLEQKGYQRSADEIADQFCRRLALLDSSQRRLFGVKSELSATFGSAFGVKLSRVSSLADGVMEKVEVFLSDPSPDDFFAVRIAQDAAHGTPIFSTISGLSSCPGETGSTKIDSLVEIEAIEYHCGDSFAATAACAGLAEGAVATIGVILKNLSPSLRNVLYRLDVAKVSPWDLNKYNGTEDAYCGHPGDSSGLDIKINGQSPSAYKIDSLPYGQSEVLLTVTRTHPFCRDFSDVQITLASQCEYDADAVYQYRTALSEETRGVGVVHPVWDYDKGAWTKETAADGPAVSSKTFSVAWLKSTADTTPTTPTTPPAPLPAEPGTLQQLSSAALDDGDDSDDAADDGQGTTPLLVAILALLVVLVALQVAPLLAPLVRACGGALGRRAPRRDEAARKRTPDFEMADRAASLEPPSPLHR